MPDGIPKVDWTEFPTQVPAVIPPELAAAGGAETAVVDPEAAGVDPAAGVVVGAVEAIC